MWDFQIELTPGEISASVEVFSARDKVIAETVRTCKKLTRDQFKKVIQPGDVIIPYKRAKYAKVSALIRFVTMANKLIQGSSFTSCKMVGKGGKVIVGYGVISGKDGISKAGIDKFFAMHEAALVLRYKGITKKQQEAVVDKMYKAFATQPTYDKKTLVWSTVHHMFGTFGKQIKDEDFNRTEQKALICSSLVLKCYQESGMTIKHDKSVGDKWIWPKEYITSDSFKVIGGYFSKESGVKGVL